MLCALVLFPSALLSAPPAGQIALCESCHGKGGNSELPGMPSIAAQPVTFLENQLVFFREGLRSSPVMQPLTNGMKDEDITALARHFSSQEARLVGSAAADRSLLARGRDLASKMHCGQCHLPKFQGREQMPRLAAQREDYLVESMIAYRDGKRTGADTTMSGILHGLSDADIKALAHFTARPDGSVVP